MKKIYLFALPFLIFSCSEENTSENKETVKTNDISAIQPPLENVGSELQSHKIEASQGGIISLKNGGTIEVPEGAFTDENGNDISGNVDIQLQEFHTLSEIISSGIPMKYDSSGVQYDFTSAGMFTINGNQDGKKLKIKDGKKLNVNLASFEETPCYNFYELNEKSGDWTYETTKNAVPNPNYQGDKIPVKPELALDTDLILDLEIGRTNKKSLNSLKSITWKYDGNDEAGVRAFLQSNPNLNGKIEKDNRSYYGYNLIVENQTPVKTIPISPAFDLTNIEEAKKIFEAEKAKFEANSEAEEMMAQGKMIRSMEIDGFGTYNWDIVNKRDNQILVKADFNIDSDIDKSYYKVFLVSKDEKVVVNYDSGSWNQFGYDPDKNYGIIICLPGNKYSFINPSEFNKIRSTPNVRDYTFNCYISKNKLANQKELDQLIEKI
jgi:hypothetical protein